MTLPDRLREMAANHRSAASAWKFHKSGPRVEEHETAAKLCDEAADALSAAQRDAERYRWLDENGGYFALPYARLTHDANGKPEWEKLLDAAIDAAIDSARSAQAGKGEG